MNKGFSKKKHQTNNTTNQFFRNGNEVDRTNSYSKKLKTDNAESVDDFEKKRILNRNDFNEKIQKLDNRMGFEKVEFSDLEKFLSLKGWLINMHPTTYFNDKENKLISGIDYYFVDEENGTFKVNLPFYPYFYLEIKADNYVEIEYWLRKTLESSNFKKMKMVIKDDLSLPNHLLGNKKTLIKISFYNNDDFHLARKIILPIINENNSRKHSNDVTQFFNAGRSDFQINQNVINENKLNTSHYINDIREYDIPLLVRASVDMDIRVGKWYKIFQKNSQPVFKEDTNSMAFSDTVVLAFDIETTKLPLKFPDSKFDQIMMISYMCDGDGFLITNREIISEDIEGFEYTPKPEYPGVFTVFNESNEKNLIIKFFNHIKELKPTIITTFNGDFFDWPFVDARSTYHDIDMFDEIGFFKDNEGQYKSSYCIHMDCYKWVKRDSYLPQGSQGLKPVTKIKLGYNPTQLDPELMTPYAKENPQLLSEYSVSDAVATYYLYQKYVHPFIFSLCTIIPLNPDETLRKGTGSLCEMLLTVQAYKKNILLPNKHTVNEQKFFEGHLLESETYVGGHVESLEVGVFRDDLKIDFELNCKTLQFLYDNLKDMIKFCIEKEHKCKIEEVKNYDEIHDEIEKILLNLKNKPLRNEKPLIYHVDVSSMYPNIMITNRLQPDSMKTEDFCAVCDFNKPGKKCDRKLDWSWRGEFYPAEMSEYNMIKKTLQNEVFPNTKSWLPPKKFDDLTYNEKSLLIKKRLSDYSKKIYHKTKQSKVILKEAIVCQRENSFYIDTVRSFRDLRYDYKCKAKEWKDKLINLKENDIQDKELSKKMMIFYESLQLAHKVILNSFYGYVMRKGSRWFSMEMAGVTCLTGAKIIQMARSLIEDIGKPLELDTDGIWCVLPSSFPESFKLKSKNNGELNFFYPCSILNYLVHQSFTNDQYQELIDEKQFKYEIRSENTIYFEFDGPYKAMILPTSKEEGKGIKKKYAVFNKDGSLGELKGFELKRRGELQLVKNFQSEVFDRFLEGDTLESCYKSVSAVADNWLDVLNNKASMINDDDFIDLICENKNMSKSLVEYDKQKSTSITTAKRLSEFLGENMIRDSGLSIKYIISAKPDGTPITERAIPVSIFSSDKKEFYLKKWTKDLSLVDFGPKDIIDWNYYIERLSSVIQKIILIPAFLQGIKNLIPRVSYPEWIKKTRIINDKQQQKLSFFSNEFKKSCFLDHQKDLINEYLNTGTSLDQNKLIMLHNDHKKNEDYILNNTCPHMTDDYVKFLNFQKIKWSVQNRNIEKKKNCSNAKTLKPNFDTLVSNDTGFYFEKYWEILEVKNNELNPGVVDVFILIRKDIYNVKFHILKKIFVSFKNKLTKLDLIKDCEFTESTALLPNGHDATNLYNLILPEKTFINEMNNPESILQCSNVLKIYESDITSDQRVVIEIGNTIKIDDTRSGLLAKVLKEGFNINDIIKVDNKNYLKSLKINVIYLLHIYTNNYEVYLVFKTWSDTADLFFKQTSDTQKIPFNIEKVYSDLFMKKKDLLEKSNMIFEYNPNMKFNTDYFTDGLKLNVKLKTVIKKFLVKKKSSILVIQSPFLTEVINTFDFIHLYPIIKMEMRKLEPPFVGWQILIIKRIINHFFNLESWMENLISLASYSNIPLCNLDVKNVGYLIDVEYARRLIEHKVVLWWSSNPFSEDVSFEIYQNNSSENFKISTMNCPEVYQTVCFEFEIETLFINTILTSSLINDIEGSDLFNINVKSDSKNNNSVLAEDSFSTLPFNIFKNMVKFWWKDTSDNNVNADSILSNLMVWIQKKNSYMYSFTLQYHIYNLTNKILLELVKEFQKLNTKLIFINKNKVLFQSTKNEIENSFAFGNYLVKSLKYKPIFNFLELKLTRYWDILFWMDEYNYGGLYCDEITENADKHLKPMNNWQIVNFLPVIYHKEFHDWILIFFDSLKKLKIEDLKKADNCLILNDTSVLHDYVDHYNDQLSENSQKFDSKFTIFFANQLKKRIEFLYQKQKQQIVLQKFKKEYEFPTLVGSHLIMENPCFELTKFLLFVLSLSKKYYIEIRILRRELLDIFDVKEFSDSVKFVNPSLSLKLLHVVCDYCNYIRDIDFCRNNQIDIWNCVLCKEKIEIFFFEDQLISQLYEEFFIFSLQDFRCSKCYQIRTLNMSLSCFCSGTWTEDAKNENFKKKVDLYLKVAKFYNFDLLKNFITDLF